MIFGLNQGLSSLARVIGPAVAGWVYAHHPTGPFALASCIALAASLWTAGLRPRSQAAHPAPAVAEPV